MDEKNTHKFWVKSKERFEVECINDIDKISWDEFFDDETIKNLPFIEFKVQGDKFSYKIDKKEFERCNELKDINWTSRLKVYEPAIIKKKNIKKPAEKLFQQILKFVEDTELADTKGNIILYEYKDLKKNETIIKKEPKKDFADKMEIILNYGFGIEDLNKFRIDSEMNKVEGIMKEFENKKTELDEITIEKIRAESGRFFYEIHFHICFLLLLDKVLGNSSAWEGEKECTRLHTLVSCSAKKVNPSSTGYIDVYFEDEYGVNIVEVKNIDPSFEISYQEVKIKGIDQVCSYILEGNVKPNLFLLTFIFNKNENKFEYRLEPELESEVLKTYESKQEKDLICQVEE
jgi:hypothetical protein